MLAVKSMDVRDNFKSLCDKVFHGETLIISRPKNEKPFRNWRNMSNECGIYTNCLGAIYRLAEER